MEERPTPVSPYKNNYSDIDCDTSELPEIDFSKYTLLSKLTQGGGCTATYQRKILNDTKNRKIIYEIAVDYEGKCEMLIGNWNFVFVPKTPDDYSVDFQIK